jgi:subtilisin family serine protease
VRRPAHQAKHRAVTVRGSVAASARALALVLAVAAVGLPTSTARAATTHHAALDGVTLRQPLGGKPAAGAQFDPGVDLRIEIFALAANGAIGSPVGPSFSVAGTGGERIKVEATGLDAHYHANWKTRDSRRPDGSSVRVEVRLPSAPAGPACNAGVSLAGGCLAFFDVGLRKGSKGGSWPAGMTVLTNGQTLPIKVHIAVGALDAPPPTASQLAAEPGSSAAGAIPEMDFEFNAADYAPHPEFGLITSFRTLYLVFTLDTTVAQANDLLAAIGGQIIGGVPGSAGVAEGILYVRVPTTSHGDMDALIARLGADPRVSVAVQDSILEADEISAPSAVPQGWTWETSPAGGNWGIEAVRAPQLWNLNRAVRKTGRTANTGVLDTGFLTGHADLAYALNLSKGTPSAIDAQHGTHVAGTIAATHNKTNGAGVDGVNPFAELVVQPLTMDEGWGGWGLYTFLDNISGLQVVNVSLGHNWYQRSPPVDPALPKHAKTRKLVADQAKIFMTWQTIRKLNGKHIPLIVGAAGNDSGNPNLGGVDVEAKWSSPWNYAAIVGGVDNVIVVEAVQLDPGGGMSRAWFSDLNGHVSAPGRNVCSTSPLTGAPNEFPCGPAGAQYVLMSGTSMAAPHVAGLAGYLMSLDPSLTPSEVRGLLMSTAQPVGGGASPVVDGFAAALAIDGLRGNSAILKRLLDIDDGTSDGSLRLVCGASCSAFEAEDADGDGGVGDGVIDMSDFRRWRDWYLLTTGSPLVSLDGDAAHAKRDVNGNGVVEAHNLEGTYPRGDFNGDGVLDLSAVRYVPGYVNRPATDLEVFESLFADDNYSAAQLSELVESSDIHVDPTGCLNSPGATWAYVTIFDASTSDWLDERMLQPGADNVLTVPFSPGGLLVRVEAGDDNGNIVGVAQKTFESWPGSDAWYGPTCGRITLTPRQVNIVLNVNDSTTPQVKLASEGLAAAWEFVSSVEHVEPALSGGSIASGAEVALDPTVTCPARPGGYGGFLDLEFRDDEGNVIESDVVPESLVVDIVCLPGGVVLEPNHIPVTLGIGESTTRMFRLTNSGTALLYEAQPDEMLAIDEAATGELPTRGQVHITVEATCPLQPGRYERTVALTFERADGKPVTVEVPELVSFTIECTSPLKLVGQIINNEIRFETLDNTWEQYWSRDAIGTAEYKRRVDLNLNVTFESRPIAPIGWGEASSVLDFTRVVEPPKPPLEWMLPHTRPGTMTGHSSVEYQSSYDGATTATWGADFSFSYTTTRPPPNLDIGQLPCGTQHGGACSMLGASADTYFEIAPNTQQRLVITWTCGMFEVPAGPAAAYGWIRLARIGIGLPNVFDSTNVQGCRYETVLGPGQYGLLAQLGLTARDSLSAGPSSGSYSVTLTYVAPEPDTP